LPKKCIVFIGCGVDEKFNYGVAEEPGVRGCLANMHSKMHACSAGLAANAWGRLAEAVGIYQAFSALAAGFRLRGYRPARSPLLYIEACPDGCAIGDSNPFPSVCRP
jgi:hypothetical protein